MERSPELEALIRRRWAAWNSRDSDALIRQYSDDPGLVVIGTDPDEWWFGAEMANAMQAIQDPELEEAGADLNHITSTPSPKALSVR